MDKNITIKQFFNNRYIKYIKGALIIDLENKKNKKMCRLKEEIADYYFNKKLF